MDALKLGMTFDNPNKSLKRSRVITALLPIFIFNFQRTKDADKKKSDK
jgi:hypothetical protein